MSYVSPDYPSKKAFKLAIAAGKRHMTYNPSGIFDVRANGPDTVEGPHYPKPHRWYAAVVVQDGIVVACEGTKLGSVHTRNETTNIVRAFDAEAGERIVP